MVARRRTRGAWIDTVRAKSSRGAASPRRREPERLEQHRVERRDRAIRSALPTPDSYEFFSAYEGTAWRNEVTLRTLELFQGYEPGEYLKLVCPTPLLMVVAANDRLVAVELACQAFETASHPKKLVLVPGGHFEAYVGRGFEISSGAARDWFVEHLITAAAVPSREQSVRA